MGKTLSHAARYLVGGLFIFSGLIKANDPMGFGYKLQEYFEVFHCAFLDDYAAAIAILLCSLEIILGTLLLLGLWMNRVAWGLLILILFFTFLTFYSAYFKVVTSCGCFGDAIPLTPWQSFVKDLLLLLLIVNIFIHRANIKSLIQWPLMQKIILWTTVLVSFGFGCYTYNYLPIFDFLPYKKNNNIPQLMKAPPGAAVDEYEITYTLKNNRTGESKKMLDKDYLKTQIWKDPEWEIVGDPESKLVKKGYEVKIKDLQILDSQGVDFTSEILENPYYTLIIVAYDLHKTNLRAIAKLNALAVNIAESHHIRTILLTASSVQDVTAFSNTNKLLMDVFYVDAVPLKSMVRANPGVLLLKEGRVINKWHYHTVPSYGALVKRYFDKV